ncbi:MAG: zinc ribbon domain-containing protein [Gemmatimonadota bacterium]|nr:zinc ribbon domain-containing protein [Gemmatimonadota bacterium]
MPLYEFRCPEGHEFEKFYRSIGGAESTAACPVCGERAERMMSAAGFAFKGSGFYLTDYGKNAHRGEAPPDAKAAASADASSGSNASEKSDSPKAESATSSSEGGKSETTKPAESAKPAAEVKKAESKPVESKKPASKPKPSAGE